MQTERLEQIASPYAKIIHQTNPVANSQLYAVAVVSPYGGLSPSEVQSQVATFQIGQELIKERGLSLLLEPGFSEAKIREMNEERSFVQRALDSISKTVGSEMAAAYAQNLPTYEDQELYDFFQRKIDDGLELPAIKALLLANQDISYVGIENPKEINLGDFFYGQGVLLPDKLRGSTVIDRYCSSHSERDALMPLPPFLFVTAARYVINGNVSFEGETLDQTQSWVVSDLEISLSPRELPNNPGIGINLLIPSMLLEDKEFLDATNIRSILDRF